MDYSGTLETVIRSGGQDIQTVTRLRATEQAILASGGQFASEKDRYYRSYLDHLLADEQLSLDEERRFEQVAMRCTDLNSTTPKWPPSRAMNRRCSSR